MEKQVNEEEATEIKLKGQLKQHEDATKEMKAKLAVFGAGLDEAVEDLNEARKREPEEVDDGEAPDGEQLAQTVPEATPQEAQRQIAAASAAAKASTTKEGGGESGAAGEGTDRREGRGRRCADGGRRWGHGLVSGSDC